MPGWVLHDFRRTGVSGLARMGYDVIVADKLLAHQPSTLTGAAAIYQRHQFAEERRQALDAWAARVLHCGQGDPRPAMPLSRQPGWPDELA